MSRRKMICSLGCVVAGLGLRRFSNFEGTQEHSLQPLQSYSFSQYRHSGEFTIDGEMSSLDEYAILYEDGLGEYPSIALRVDRQGLLLRSAFLSEKSRHFVSRNWRWQAVAGDDEPLRPMDPLSPAGTVRLAASIRRRLREHLGLKRIDCIPSHVDRAVISVIDRVHELGCLDRRNTSPFDHVAAHTGGVRATWTASCWFHSDALSPAAHRRIRERLVRADASVRADCEYDGECHLSAEHVLPDGFLAAIKKVAGTV